MPIASINLSIIHFMTNIQDLQDVSLPRLHAAFTDAFSNYEVSMAMPMERLAETMQTRSYDARLSLGYFADGELVAFILVGCREIEERKVAYNLSTGVARAFQKQGMGDILLKALLHKLREEGIQEFVLEVLVNNHAAQKLYERNGFQIKRRLNCYEKSLAGQDKASLPGQDEYAVKQMLVLSEASYNSFAPSWQNSFASYQCVSDKYQACLLTEDGHVQAYGIVHKERGSLLQLGIHPQKRNPEIAGRILELIADATRSEKLVIVNIEANSDMEAILLKQGFTPLVSQYEMHLSLA
jgi:ribosomal protein S18 acetylase RimI-like enzyme